MTEYAGRWIRPGFVSKIVKTQQQDGGSEPPSCGVANYPTILPAINSNSALLRPHPAQPSANFALCDRGS